MELDASNGNTKWRDSELLELAQIDDYETFDGRGMNFDPGPEYTKITVHMVYAVKQDGRHKSRLMAGGHLTDTPINAIYSSVVSLRGVRIVIFLSELNKCMTWVTDIRNAYLESYTSERVCIIAGPEFGYREGHTLIIIKALYGLKISARQWSHQLGDVLKEIGFILSKADKEKSGSL